MSYAAILFVVSLDLVVVPTVQILIIFFDTAPSLTIFNFSSQPGIRAKPGFSHKQLKSKFNKFQNSFSEMLKKKLK